MSHELNGEHEQATPPAPDAEGGQPAVPGSQDVSAGSSTATDVETADSSTVQDVKDADSSSANGVDRQSLLDVTRSALSLGKKSDSASPAKGQGAENSASGSTPTQASDASDAPEKSGREGAADVKDDGERDKTSSQDTSSTKDNLSTDADDTFADADKLPFGKHPRFKRLLAQWNRDRGPAHQYRQITSFLDEHGVSNEDAANALKLAALVRQAQLGSVEHAKLVLKDLMPLLAHLRQLTGEEIAPDLQEKVAAGTLDESAAKELTQTRVRAAAADERAKVTADQIALQRQREFANTVAQAVSEWDAGVRTRDPEFPRKEKLVYSTLKRLAAERGRPQSPKEAVELAQAAYEEVNKAFEGLEPVRRSSPKQPTQQHAPTNSAPRSAVRPVPKDPVEITRLALERSRAAS